MDLDFHTITNSEKREWIQDWINNEQEQIEALDKQIITREKDILKLQLKKSILSKVDEQLSQDLEKQMQEASNILQDLKKQQEIHQNRIAAYKEYMLRLDERQKWGNVRT